MTKKEILGYFLFLVFLVLSANYFLTLVDNEQSSLIEKTITIEVEKAYFEGQKDALEGKIKIGKTNNDKYHWINGGPWNSQKAPIWKP